MAREQLSDILSEFARTMVTDFPIQSILDRLVERIVDVLPITGAGVTLISPGVEPHFIAASNDDALRYEQLQTELNEGPCLAAYRTGEAVEVPDLLMDQRFPRFAARALEAGLRGVFTFPLHHSDRQLGALDLYRDSPGGLRPASLTAAQTLADVASAYLLNAQARAALLDSSDRLREASLHDSLTGLANRTLVLERLEHACLRGQRSHKTSAVLFVDLDRFKAVNDTYGHRIGDELLVAVADRLSSVLRPGDTLARLSGDEFVILCEDLASPSQADAIVARVDTALQQRFVLSGRQVTMTASVGVAFTGRGNDMAERLLSDADMAMYRAKRAGGGRHQILDLREQQLADREAGLERDLPGATGRGELHLAYQPIVASLDGEITGVEALLRWAHPSRGTVSPTILIPIAEQSGLIVDIGRWVLEQARSDQHRWQSRLPADFAMSVNVSGHQFMSAGFADSVAAVLDTTRSLPRFFTLEVTESVFLRDADRALMVMSDLRDIGVKLALDDFGTGYSSLSYLRRFPVDILKIDRAFVSDIGRDATSHTIVTSVIELAHGLGMMVVAEGVETPEQHRELTRLGCDSCQGYYFARPMMASSLDLVMHHGGDGSTPRFPPVGPAA